MKAEEVNPKWVSAPMEKHVWTPEKGLRVETEPPYLMKRDRKGEWSFYSGERFTINSRGEYVKVK